MNAGAVNTETLMKDGTPLKVSLKRSQLLSKVRAFGLVGPLLLFVVITFVMPIITMLTRSVDNHIVPDILPKTVVALRDWDAKADELPSETVYKAFIEDMQAAIQARAHTKLGQRLNYDYPGMSGVFRSTGRKIKRLKLEQVTSFKDELISIHKAWGKIETWQTIQLFSDRYTDVYLLRALDMTRVPDGEVKKIAADKSVYVPLFIRTFTMCLLITLIALVLGFPIAYLISSLPQRYSNMLLILVLLPFWTSLLVRTTSWIVLLQNKGVINDLLVGIGLITEEGRLTMIYNATGTVIAMVHILLPFMILPMYSVMKTIPASYMRAAQSLGASRLRAFWKVYFPNTIPGVGAGTILVFILAIGYYITPELVGGSSGSFISNSIALHISSTLNWGLAAALGVMLLILVLILYLLYNKIVGIDNIKMG